MTKEENENIKDRKICSSSDDSFSSTPLSYSDMMNSFSSKLDLLIQDLLSHENVHFADVHRLNSILTKFCDESNSKLQVITDFDRTLSSYTCHDGSISITSYQCLASYKNEVFKMNDIHEELTKKFFPAEFYNKMEHEEKVKFMIEWWEATNAMIVNSGLSKHNVYEASFNDSLQIRKGFIEIIDCFRSKNIPILVVSAGLGDIVVNILERELKDLEGLKIVSNFLKFNKDGIVDAFTQPLLHSYNKNMVFEMANDYFHQHNHRRNTIIFGDQKGDIDVVQNVPYRMNCLKIGFINFDKEKLISEFLDVFDIVVTDSRSVGPLNQLIEFLTDAK